MNKPAPKEPSMDEILSSIRQIIADDDAGARKPAPPPVAPAPVVVAVSAPPRPAGGPPAPLSLSPEQIVADDEPEPETLDFEAALRFEAALATDDEDELVTMVDVVTDEAAAVALPRFDEADLVDGDDITFEAEIEAEAEPEPEPVMELPPRPRPSARPAAPVSRAAPMPDPTLSSDIAEQLLEPTTAAAVHHTFAKLGTLAIGAPGVTIEDMLRDMLRPMLKEWLDENLPTVVERMVEKEISRISRGGE